MSEPTLFEIEDTPVRSPKRKPTVSARAVYRPYRAKNPYKCDACKQAQHEANGNAPLARQARYRRLAPNDPIEPDLYLCGPHKVELEQRDRQGEETTK